MIILHNPYSRLSRQFIKIYGGGATIIDWYNDIEAKDYYLAQGFSAPSEFPFLVDEATGICASGATSLSDLEDAITETTPKLVREADGLKVVKEGASLVNLYIGGRSLSITLDNGIGIMPFLKEGDYDLLYKDVGEWEVLHVTEVSSEEVAPSAGVFVSADNQAVSAGKSVVLTITCDDIKLANVPIAVWSNGKKLGTFDVALSGGMGVETKSISVAGVYEYKVDDVPHPDWPEMNLYRNEQSAEVVAI